MKSVNVPWWVLWRGLKRNVAWWAQLSAHQQKGLYQGPSSYWPVWEYQAVAQELVSSCAGTGSGTRAGVMGCTAVAHAGHLPGRSLGACPALLGGRTNSCWGPDVEGVSARLSQGGGSCELATTILSSAARPCWRTLNSCAFSRRWNLQSQHNMLNTAVL